MIKGLAVLLAMSGILGLGGCANGFKNFYRPTTSISAVEEFRSGPPMPVPEVQHGSYPINQSVEAMGRRGYLVMGYSSYNGPRGSISDAVAEGKRVGADLVLVFDPRYTGARTSTLPITTPTSSTTYYSGTATAYGSGGSATAYGSGTATTYGSQTSYIPISTNRYDFVAVYLFKVRVHTGFIGRFLTDPERQTIGSNAGEYINEVVDGSPAYLAGVLHGDIVTEVDGKPLTNTPTTTEYIKSHYGEPVTFTIYRNGQYITKTFAPLR